jgi:hypothetical protein
MKYNITLLEMGQEPLSIQLDVNFLEGKKLADGDVPHVSIAVGDGCGEGSVRIPLYVLGTLMSKITAAANARRASGLLVPDNGLVGPNGEALS